MAQRALIIDDEPDIRELIALSLDRVGLDTYTAGNIADAKNLIENYEFDVCLTDMRLPDGNGIDFVKYLQARKPQLPVAVITAHGNIDSAVDAMKNGAFDFVSKPIDINLLRKLVTQAISSNEQSINEARHSKASNHSQGIDDNPSLEALSQRRTTHANTEIGIGVLIGQSQPMHKLRSMIAKVAKTNAPVWITGESGTGKELIAHLIHDNGSRSGKPFIAVNCGAIPAELMESEMFGHKKGSFTGAHSDHEGLFKRADGGTLFLDEVAELPLHMQVKLLRAIQERSIRQVGGSDELVIDVRILSASHKNLNAEVEAGTFRHDLYYRLNVICIKSPSLRDRPTDIPIIARHILQSIKANDPSIQATQLTSEAEDHLASYSFPGNVRELENIIERAITLSESNLLAASDLNLGHSNGSAVTAPSEASEQSTDNYVDEVHQIKQALQQTRWNRKAAAVQLGLTYRQLRYRLQQYGIDDKSTGT